MVSPGLASAENTLNTLRYADRVKDLGATDQLILPPTPDTHLPHLVNIEFEDSNVD